MQPGKVLDLARLEMFRTLKPDDTSLLDRIIAPAGSAHDLVKAAHGLSGGAHNVGAPRVAAACEDLELLGHTQDLQAAVESVRLVDAWAEEPDIICVVYEGWWFPGRLGLRRKLDHTARIGKSSQTSFTGSLANLPEPWLRT